MAAAGVHFAAVPGAGRAELGDLVSGEIIEEIHAGAAGGFADALAFGIIHVAGGRGGTVAGRAVHLDNAIFGVIKIGVRAGTRAVVGQISRKVIADASDAGDVIVGVEAQLRGVRAILVPAVPEAVVVVGVGLTGSVGGQQAIEIVISIGPVAVYAVIRRKNVAVRGEAAAGRDGQGIKRAVGDGGQAQARVVRPRFRDSVAEPGRE